MKIAVTEFSGEASWVHALASQLEQQWSRGDDRLRTAAWYLRKMADAIAVTESLRKAPDGRSVVEELTYAERKALPGRYHQPVWMGLATPSTWICLVCWDEGEQAGWPCKAAERDGAEVAEAGRARPLRRRRCPGGWCSRPRP